MGAGPVLGVFGEGDGPEAVVILALGMFKNSFPDLINTIPFVMKVGLTSLTYML